jgi:hypothetical protein
MTSVTATTAEDDEVAGLRHPAPGRCFLPRERVDLGPHTAGVAVVGQGVSARRLGLAGRGRRGGGTYG